MCAFFEGCGTGCFFLNSIYFDIAMLSLWRENLWLPHPKKLCYSCDVM